LIFIKGYGDENRQPKMTGLIREAGEQLVRRRFGSTAELIGATYAALVQVLEERRLIRSGPFDASQCPKATLNDLSREKLTWFLRRARTARGYPLLENTPLDDTLAHLNLLDEQHPTHAAVLLFGENPQRFLISSEVKCLHFHGTEVRKPIPSYQIYKGTVFELIDQAVDFVMSKLNRRVGTREAGPTAAVEYDLPQEVVAEGIVNAVAHRDYTSAASVQVMLFADRLEIWNPGRLPSALSLAALRRPHASHPGNPLIAEPLFLSKYIEKAGTGTLDMIKRCREQSLPEPGFRLEDDSFVLTLRRQESMGTEIVAKEVEAHDEAHEFTGEVGTKSGPSRDQVKTLKKCREDATLVDLLAVTGRSNRTKFRDQVLNPLIAAGLIEMTIPDKPRSSKQRYRLTNKGRRWLKEGGATP
jgi:predicted HTH transcriptional regulator